MASASVSLTTRTGSFSSSASFAALRRRAPATTSYLLCSSSRTRRGARMPWVLKLAASSSRLLASNRLRGLVADSASAVMGTLRYSWLATAFCVLCIVFSPVLFLWLGDIGAHIGRGRPTSRWFSGYAAAVPATGSGAQAPRLVGRVC